MAVWWARRALPSAGFMLLAISSDDHADGEIVPVEPDAPLPAEPLMTAHVVDDQVRELHVGAQVSATAPPLWYVEQPQPDAQPPAMVLVAFDTDDLPEGSVVGQKRFARMRVHSGTQVGAVRWSTDSGVVHQVYVAPKQRRRGIGTKLIAAAGAYRAAKGWAPIWSDGERSDVGEEHVRSLPRDFQHRLRPRATGSEPTGSDTAPAATDSGPAATDTGPAATDAGPAAPGAGT